MAAVSVIGSGNVGANTAFFIAEKGIADVALYDIRDGLATGKALDMMEAAPIRSYRTTISALESLDAIADSEIVVLAAGLIRKPGMKRDDLLKANGEMVEALAPSIARLAPAAKVIVATEPVDLITRLFCQASHLPRTQILGLGGFLDSTRLRYFIARELAVAMDNVSALVIGRHTEAMIGLPSYCRVSGIPLTRLVSLEKIEALIEETRGAGDLIVDMAQRANAYYAPSAAAAELVDAIHRDLKRIIPVSLVLDGEYGLHGVALSLPAVIGAAGVLRVLTPKLTPQEHERLVHSVQESAEKRESP